MFSGKDAIVTIVNLSRFLYRGRTSEMKDIQILNDFLLSESGMILLDSVCMKLIAIGESVKKLDRLTNKDLLKNYPSVDWKGVMAMRDIIVHHYFEIDAEIVFQTIHDDLPLLRDVLLQVQGDVELSRM